jgi:hypothetical protein
MATKNKTINGQKLLVPNRRKKTRQGNGANSKASHGRKLSRGQGK